MSGPWEKYQAAQPVEDGPWSRYASGKEPSMMDDIKQGAGNVVAGAVRGAGSIGATILTPIDAAARALGVQNEFIGRTDRREAMDEGLRSMGADPESILYKGGKLGAEIAGTSGVGGTLAKVAQTVAPSAVGLANALATGGMRAGATPGVANMVTRMVGGGATGAAAAGLVDPEYTGSGAAVGAAMPPALAGLGKVGQSVGRSFAIGDGNRDLARTAVQKYEIPLGVGDIAEGGTTKALRSILNDAPFSGGVGAAQRESVQAGFNKAVGGTFGANEAKLTPEVIDAAKKRMGAEFDRIWNGNTLAYDGQLFKQIQALKAEAAKLPGNADAHHGGGDAARLMAWLKDVESKMQIGSNNELYLPGDVANRLQSKLRKETESASGFLRDDLGTLRKALIDAFNRNVSAADAQALTANRSQYKAFKTVEPLLNSAEAGVAGRMPGDVPAALLPQAVARSYSQAGGTPLAELAQIGSRFIVDRTPRTGGSMRAALQNTALGTALVGGGLSNPMLAAGAIPAAAGVNALLGSPALAQYLLRDSGQNALTKFITSPEVAQIAYRAAPVVSAR